MLQNSIQPFTQVALQSNLRNLGLVDGDTVMVHASLRAIGPVEGRATGLINSILSVLGPSGTLMAYVDYEPTSEVPYFDLQRSPAMHQYGVLPEIVRTSPGAVRSFHPGASMVAIGAKAEWICCDHSFNYGYGPGSPLGKLVEANGKVLLLGSDLDCVTLLHYVEHCADLPGKRVIHRPEKMLLDGEVIDIVIEEFDTSRVVLDAMPERYFAIITKAFIDAGLARTGLVGRAQTYLLPSREFVSFAHRKMEAEFGPV